MSKKITLSSLTIAAALLLSYVESLIPPLISAIPGIKMGLANIAVIFALYCIGNKEALVVSFLRVVLSALLFGNMISLIYSLCGAILSFAIMALLKRFSPFSLFGISICGAVAHNVGQILAAIFVIGSVAIAYYLPVLIISAVITGAVIGLLSALVIGRIEKSKIIK